MRLVPIETPTPTPIFRALVEDVFESESEPGPPTKRVGCEVEEEDAVGLRSDRMDVLPGVKLEVGLTGRDKVEVTIVDLDDTRVGEEVAVAATEASDTEAIYASPSSELQKSPSCVLIPGGPIVIYPHLKRESV